MTHGFGIRSTVFFILGFSWEDTDLFHDTPQMKAKIHEIFRFMFASNLCERNHLGRAVRLFTFDLSRKLDAVAPPLERTLFTGPVVVWQLMKKTRDSVA